MTVETVAFEPERYLQTQEAQEHFLTEAIESGNARYITHALGVVARARGMSELARDTGLNRQALYAAFSEGGNPRFETVLKLLGALGLEMKIAPRGTAEADHTTAR